MHRHHQDIGNALVAFVLKVVFRHPEGVVAQPVHKLRHRLGFVEHGDQMFVRKATVIHGCTAIADIGHVDVTGEQTIELGNHATFSGRELAVDPVADNGS